MKLHSYKFGLAAALTTLIVLVIVALLILIVPELVGLAPGDVSPDNIGNLTWPSSLMAFMKGLFFWSICVGLAVWLFAELYNRL